MDNETQEPTTTEESVVINESNAIQQEVNTEASELNFNLERKNSHGDDMPSLDVNIIANEPPNTEFTQDEIKDELIEENITEDVPKMENSDPELNLSTETPKDAEEQEVSIIELSGNPPIEVDDNVDIKTNNLVEGEEGNTVPSEVIEVEDEECPKDVEEDVQIITPDDPPLEEVETHVLVENEINFSHDQEEPNTSMEVQNSEETPLGNVEYGVILNDNQTDGIAINGVHELTKEALEGELYEPKVDEGFNPETMEDLVTIASEVHHEDGSIITLPSDTVTEVTFTNVEMLDPAVVTINELGEEPGEVVEQVILMETEEYDHPESINVNVIENDHQEEELEEEMDEMEEDIKSNEHSNIPCHVLGRSIDNPLVDPVRNGRVLLKPRLGVKIPYRNLTSQIVSKQEIAEEIMERSRLRQSAAEPPAGGDVFFAKKLTQRLAKKLVPTNKPNRSSSRSMGSSSSASGSSKKVEIKKPKTEITVASIKVIESPKSPPPKTNSVEPSKIIEPSEKIIDNSDLIALLEGDDVPDWNIATKSTETKPDPKRSSEWEREVALKQLKELPKHSRGGFKSSSSKYVSGSPSNKEVEKVEKGEKESPPQKEVEEEEKEDLNIEPRFSSNAVVKTYTRKRKPFPEELKTSPGTTQSKKGNEEKVGQKPPAVVVPPKTSSSSVQKTSKTPTMVTPTVQKSQTSQKPSPKIVPEKQSDPPVVQKSTPKKVEEKKEKKLVPEKKEQLVEKRRASTPEIQTPIESKKTLSPNTYISKSSRIVKRKKIWDPDEVTPVSKLPLKSPEKSVSSKVPEKKSKPIAAAVLKPSNEKLPAKTIELPKQKLSSKPIAVLKPSNEKPTLKKVKKSIVKKKRLKRLTEVDRLLMDEGAVNLLYSVNKNTEEILKKKKMKTLISLDRAQRELQNKTNEIKNDLELNSTKDSPINLRKKEGGSAKSSPMKDLGATVLHRKKSKDSMSGSVHSPPASPGFAYSQHADASRIIRRHSSSSFSSETSEEDEEEDIEEEEEENESGVENTNEKKNKGEPQKKKAKLNPEKQSKRSIGIDKQLLNEEMSKNFNRPPSDDPKYSKFQTFSVRKFENLTQIILASTSPNGQTTLSVQVLAELAEVLNLLQKDDSCRVVVLSSSGSSFCEGIDYKELASDDKTERQSIAEKFAVSVRVFLMALSEFPKILVAGVHGNTIGLGVTMLPLFDMVLASDTATFSTPYARLGCAAEGGVLLTLPHVMHNALASELFFASRKLTAAEALRLGLVTRTLWPDKFQEELISALKLIAGQSLQSMQAMKKQLRHHLLLNVEASLKSESSILIEHWTSNECQSNFSNYNLENK